VYDVLPRLERSGHARRRIVHQTERPDKHLWRITRRGRAALTDWINTIDEDSLENRGVLLLKLFSASMATQRAWWLTSNASESRRWASWPRSRRSANSPPTATRSCPG
jgi:DNA-binding PadR family transcriptional regulator